MPPELSPLDAFAAQSRMLARKLKESNEEGKRLSRLPPSHVEATLGPRRPSFLRAASAQEPPTHQDKPPNSPGLPMRMEIERAQNRPVSVHPRMSKVPTMDPDVDLARMRGAGNSDDRRGRKAFDTRNDLAPPMEESSRSAPVSPRLQMHDSSKSSSPNRKRGNQFQPSLFPSSQGLPPGMAPPRCPLVPVPRQKSHLTDSNGRASSDLQDVADRPPLRKFSSSSAVSTSAVSPVVPNEPRSSSPSSTMSSSNRLSRPTFNFSRPLSRIEPPFRESSGDSDAQSTGNTSVPSLLNLPLGDSFSSNLDIPSSYTYSKFVLPAGQPLKRSSSTPADTRTDERTSDEHHPLERSKTSGENSPSLPFCNSPADARASLDIPPPATKTGQATTPRPQTFRATTQNKPEVVDDAEQTAEWHVSKGIECHENGSVNESTYHLRIAARQNHPTGMLLYALACRHGWGMRPNQQEGVQWLRKAADLAQLEVADDEGLVKEGKSVDIVTQRTRKAQFALSIYELGISHLNGWGIEQDKALALRCFEIAGCKCCSDLICYLDTDLIPSMGRR